LQFNNYHAGDAAAISCRGTCHINQWDPGLVSNRASIETPTAYTAGEKEEERLPLLHILCYLRQNYNIKGKFFEVEIKVFSSFLTFKSARNLFKSLLISFQM
jgi:hypothetical protein